MIVLLTGFDRFHNHKENSSEVVVKEIAENNPFGDEVTLITEILKTEFNNSVKIIKELIARHKPGILLMLGMVKGHNYIRLEKQALNKTNSSHIDNAGACYVGEKILDGSLDELPSTIPVEQICEQLNQQGISAKISESAGDYVCNHAYYHALYQINDLGLETKTGFIHIPDPENDPGSLGKENTIEAIIYNQIH